MCVWVLNEVLERVIDRWSLGSFEYSLEERERFRAKEFEVVSGEKGERS